MQVRVIAPSFSWEPGYEDRDARATQRLAGLGYEVTFGKHLAAQRHLGTASAAERVADLHEAFTDDQVGLVMAYSGGWSANELLPLIDWDLLRAKPKPLIGYSDITVLVNALYAKTGNPSCLGPTFGTFGEETHWQYTLDNFVNVVQQKRPLELAPSHVGDWKILQPGEAKATLLGGNFNTFHLLQGTEYQPELHAPFILLAEDDDESGALTPQYFSRRLESILQLPGARTNLRGIIIGRFLPTSQFPTEVLADIIGSKNLGDIPVIAGMDFGHTLPMLTLPIGGTMHISATSSSAQVQLLPTA